jgi:hypothetical protein
MRNLLLTGCLATLTLALPHLAEARPYRSMITRTAETTSAGFMEFGLRYQGFMAGSGREDDVILESTPYHQLAAHLRYSLTSFLEIDTQVEVLADLSNVEEPVIYFGDIPIGLQLTLASGEKGALGLFGRATIPTGPGHLDDLPPTLSDGTFDAEVTILGELRFSPSFRLMLNLGYLHHGTRDRGELPDFDIPDAVRLNVAGTFNVDDKLLLGLELVSHSFLRKDITPVWLDNQHLVEVIASVRYEISPRLVLEAALGISVSKDLQQMYLLRPLLGLTYEFEFPAPPSKT